MLMVLFVSTTNYVNPRGKHISQTLGMFPYAMAWISESNSGPAQELVQ